MKLAGKNARITGGASGNGLAIARLLARECAAVDLLDLSGGELKPAVAGITETGGTAGAHPCDVTDAAAVETAVARVRERRGRIHLLINNAGIAHIGNALTTP